MVWTRLSLSPSAVVNERTGRSLAWRGAVRSRLTVSDNSAGNFGPDSLIVTQTTVPLLSGLSPDARHDNVVPRTGPTVTGASAETAVEQTVKPPLLRTSWPLRAGPAPGAFGRARRNPVESNEYGVQDFHATSGESVRLEGRRCWIQGEAAARQASR